MIIGYLSFSYSSWSKLLSPQKLLVSPLIFYNESNEKNEKIDHLGGLFFTVQLTFL